MSSNDDDNIKKYERKIGLAVIELMRYNTGGEDVQYLVSSAPLVYVASSATFLNSGDQLEEYFPTRQAKLKEQIKLWEAYVEKLKREKDDLK